MFPIDVISTSCDSAFLSPSDGFGIDGIFPTIQCKYSLLSSVKCPSGFDITSVQKQSFLLRRSNSTTGLDEASLGFITFP